jgi:hypothetical protein
MYIILDKILLDSHGTNKTDHHDITEILLKVALNTITLTHDSKGKLPYK